MDNFKCPEMIEWAIIDVEFDIFILIFLINSLLLITVIICRQIDIIKFFKERSFFDDSITLIPVLLISIVILLSIVLINNVKNRIELQVTPKTYMEKWSYHYGNCPK